MRIRKQYDTRNRVVELINNLKEMSRVERDYPFAELSEVGWIYPISLLPLVTYAGYNNISIECLEEDVDIYRYLGSICFPDGTTELNKVGKDFLPITRLVCAHGNKILGLYEDRILGKVSEEYRDPFLTGLKYLTSELESNVREHAKVEEYWIFAQYWAATRTCEIGICDTGIGYKASYEGTPYAVTKHIDAIMNALRGKSSKHLQERGAGIPSLVRMFVKGYNGEMIIMSGDSLLYAHYGRNIAYKFGLIFPGSFIGLRFRLKEIDIYDYL